MELQKQIASYLNSNFIFQKNLRNGIVNLSHEKKFENFANSYRVMYEKKKVEKIITIDEVQQLRINEKDVFLRPLKEFKEYILKNFSDDELVGAYVHGSLGTMDYIPYSSDFDAILIIKKEVLEDKSKLSKIRKKIAKVNSFLYLLDPLQHHNLFIISELDMKYYFEPIFPLILFKYAKEVTGFRNKLVFRCLDDSEELNNIFNLWYNAFLNLPDIKFYKKNSYYLKRLVQSTLFLPVVYLQFKNKDYMYKKYSFKIAKKDFSNSEWDIIERCSNIRKTWKYKSYYPYWLRKFIGFHIHYKFLVLIHRFFDRNDFNKIIPLLGEDFVQDIKNLVIKMRKNSL
ncbi:hypothetical protein KAI32_02855 [Candidatus Pacearchaeota archaeon]|nr:hypothetical protein [Candidatus Pacearchaeota archaeon]